MMFFFVLVALACLAIGVEPNRSLECVTPSTPAFPCTLSYTFSLPTPIIQVETVYATTTTAQVEAVDCKYCQVTNICDEPTITGPFTSTTTSQSLVLTQIACINEADAMTRLSMEPDTLLSPSKRQSEERDISKAGAVEKPALRFPNTPGLFKRQESPSVAGSPLMLMDESLDLIEQLFTVLYSIGVINSGSDLRARCRQLGSANAILDLADVGINATQAADIVCMASESAANLELYNQSSIATAASGLYAVQIAANFTGTVDPQKLCSQLELDSLADLGVDVEAVEQFICMTDDGMTPPTGPNDTAVSTQSVFAMSTAMPFPLNNSSTGGVFPSSMGSAANLASIGFTPSGTGSAPFPLANSTAGSEIGGGPVSTSTGQRPSSMDNAQPIAANGNSTSSPINGTGNVADETEVDEAGSTLAPSGMDGTASIRPGGSAGVGNGFNGNETRPAGSNSSVGSTMVTATSDECLELPSESNVAASEASETSREDDGEEQPFRVPQGPTSTPGYYARIF